ncbi:MAG TPA: thiamine pyrophosphate-dependent dehydrogenase E1 component subunit alpha [Nitrososphaerales archaeon]|nr:thiamine pyrophosphate-dependent dehydrogenase E1 component subunit alpha [Nitrososphaerales archaeon]
MKSSVSSTATPSSESSSSMLQILRPDGELVQGARDPMIPTEELLVAYRNMVLTRSLDEKLVALQRQGRLGTYVSSSGQEATQVGVTLGISKGNRDWVFPMYRDLGVVVQMGVPLDSILDRLFSNENDKSLGRDLPNAYGWKEYRIFSLAAPIASHVCPAVGFAMAARMRNDDLVTVATFGDGATSSSEFHVGMNFAGVYKAPAILVCENNQYAISVPVTLQTASESIAIKATAYGFEGVKVDGNDLMAVYSAVSAAAEKARRGDGPTLIECYTYRIGAHSTSDDWKKYRSQEEVESWKRKDPLPRVMNYLEKKRNAWSREKETQLRSQLDAEISKAIQKSESLPPPPVATMFDDVYAKPTWNVLEGKIDEEQEQKEK